MRYLLFLFVSLLSTNGFSQQSSLDTIAVQIQTYINNNEIKLENRWWDIAHVNDSLHLDSTIRFLREIEFDKSKLKDSSVYHLIVMKDPIQDTVIVDVFHAGWRLGEVVFANYGVYGEFKGGMYHFNKSILDFIKKSGYKIDSLVNVELYFDNETPSKLMYARSENDSISRLIEQFCLDNEIERHYPPISYGYPKYSSYKFEIWDEGEKQKSFDFAKEANEYESVTFSDFYIYTLSITYNKIIDFPILVFDRKKELKDILTKEFLSQFDKIHHNSIRKLLYNVDEGVRSGIFKVNVYEKSD